MNYEAISVIIAAIANSILGGIWYTVLENRWLKAWKLNKESLKSKDPKPYLIAFIGSLWASYGLFLIIKHINPKNIEELLTIAIGSWLFILVGLSAKHYAFARVKFEAFIIDYFLDLVGITLMSFIIWSY